MNQLHRTALNQAVHRLNSEHTADKKIIILVGTKNIVSNLLMAMFSKNYIILYFTGLGRLYTDFGLLGRTVFSLVIILASLRKQRKFIVENSHDRRVVSRWTKCDVALVNGSGFNKALYKKKPHKAQKQRPLTIGHMSRFGTSKCTDQVLKMIASLPDHCKMIIAGKDISGTYYSDQFYQLARSHNNVQMKGFLENPEEASDFFQSIDIFLYPSLREGLPMTLLESIYFHVPFLSTNVAGCIDLSNRFGFPAHAPEDFGDQNNHVNLENWGQYTQHWDVILEEFSIKTVQKQFEDVFRAALLENKAYSPD